MIKNIRKFIEQYIFAVKTYNLTNNILSAFRKENDALKEALKDPIEVVNALTNNQFEWYDYTELPQNEQIKYYDQAEQILKSDVFQNEMAKLNSEWISWAAKQSRNFDGVLAMRHQMSGVNMFRERLEEIKNPRIKQEEVKDPYATI